MWTGVFVMYYGTLLNFICTDAEWPIKELIASINGSLKEETWSAGGLCLSERWISLSIVKDKDNVSI